MTILLEAFSGIGRAFGLGAAIALGAMALEFLASLANDEKTHDAGESLASFAIAFIRKGLGLLTAGAVALPLFWLYQFRLFDIPSDSLPWLAAAFVLTDFCYYWHHYAMHKIRLLWATHNVHHSPTKMNLTAAIRLGIGGQFTGGLIFYSPLILIGFHPLVVITMIAAGLFYQLFIHPAKAPNLGPLEYILNTPRHHQVHHASNETCLDKNFGGVFIVFDRVFGTFAEAPRNEPLKFGLVGREPTNNPLSLLFREWAAIMRDLFKARSLRQGWRALFSMKAGH
ncbi:sterol desaturase family protein [Rhizobium sp. L1K21]|uniref:sterol desaturase family protein n=1 Tax=Rhizobium sp. L1K21 TaxID=2954933 RepID=UPI0020929349|nr:sterol desaturase family protein [Rhizobium sp. L1K21]MCO6185092.1 sterol desaturase family protein [Rhizobium sp. L1K21]